MKVPWRLWAVQLEAALLAPYRGESLVIRSRARILLAALVVMCVAMLVTAFPPLIDRPLVTKAVILVLFLFFPGLIWLLARGHRGLVTWVYAVGLLFVSFPAYFTTAAEGYHPFVLDNLQALVLLHLIVVSAITERWQPGLVATLLAIGALAWVAFGIQGAFPEASLSRLWTVFNRSVVNVVIAECIVVLVQQGYNRSVASVEAANASLEAKVADRTDQLRRAQALLWEGERLAVLGRLTASVTHEINTPLGAIQASNQTIRTTLPDVMGRGINLFRRLGSPRDAQLVELLDRSLTDGGRSQGLGRRQHRKELEETLEDWGSPAAGVLADLLVDTGIPTLDPSTRGLLTSAEGEEAARFIAGFAAVLRSTAIVDEAVQKASEFLHALRESLHDQNSQTPLVEVDLRANLRSALVLLEARWPPGIRLVADLDESSQPITVRGRPGRLMQIWTNLVVNALDALGSQGSVELRLGTEVDEAVVEISDDGPGIPADLVTRVFEPFFTTKASGVGTGLGLGIVQANVEEHLGSVAVTSAPGQTVFRVRLPLSDARTIGP